MLQDDVPGLREFLSAYPLMALRPSNNGMLTLKGRFDFSASHPERGNISGSFFLKINVPRTFPRDLPAVFETGKQIPKDVDYHVNPANGSLCLGSPLKILLTVSQEPTLMGFAQKLLVPYLYAVSHKLRNGGRFVFDELDHGSPGLLDDYSELFGLDRTKVCSVLKLLGMKKRLANKHMCPCGCERRLGKCRFNRKVAAFRPLASRAWYKKQCGLLLNLIAVERKRDASSSRRWN
jgi:hypothetical protein